MSVLAPLYLLGILAVSLPILFHLIRRRPTGAMEFSSLMFLQPTPPRLTRRSRLENWPLLLLRALALTLLAAAFARPFFRKSDVSSDDAIGKRVVILLDTSASMRREDLWQQATALLKSTINEFAEKDQFAIVTFDQVPRVAFSLEQASQLGASQRKTAALAAISETSPSWKATDLGRAISYAADMVSQYESDDVAKRSGEDESHTSLIGESSLVLISDMQQGSQIESLQQYAWPKNLSLEVHGVSVSSPTNASAQVLPDAHIAGDVERIRVRVSNAEDSEKSRFTLSFDGQGDLENQIELPIQVPPGESRVVKMPIPNSNVTSVLLRGDDHAFDNQRYVISHEPEQLTLLFVGPELGDETAVSNKELPSNNTGARDSLLYYLKKVPLDTWRGNVTVVQVTPDKLTTVPGPESTPLIVVGRAVSSDVASKLKRYVAQGGRLLFALSRPEDKDMRAAIVEVTSADSLSISEADIKDYVMLANIDFGHPVFQPMSDPQFNDFTKVRFWTHRTIGDVPQDWSVLANFDDGDPALLEYRSGSGRVWMLASGWQPSSSQLALSTKFLPLVFSFFGHSSNKASEFGTTEIGETPPFGPTPKATITAPSGMEIAYSTSSDADQIDHPGIYAFNGGDKSKRFAVNLAATESNTTRMNNESLERFGIKLGKPLSVAQRDALKRQLRDIELEKQQKVWQWLMMIALVLLAVETLWGGLISRGSRRTSSEAPI